MKTRGFKDLYLPKRIAKHIKFLLFCVVVTPIWGLIIKAQLNTNFLLSTLIIMYILMEILYFISKKILILNVSSEKKDVTRKDVTRIYLFRLALFYIVSVAVATFSVVVYLYFFHLVNGYDIPPLTWFLESIISTLKTAATGFLFMIPVFFFVPWQQSMKREFELREQNLIFQNETLKNQVNPHFLFNSLNTLSSLINNEVEIAGQFTAKLSIIYRYILDNSAKTKIPLKEEIDFIRDYFYMHQIRNEGKIALHIDIKENEYVHEILPVSLQLLVENAIKHNMATVDKPLVIHIYLENGYIVVNNNIQKMATQIASTKIGLKNLNERIRLVTGKEIIISKSEEYFMVKVPLII